MKVGTKIYIEELELEARISKMKGDNPVEAKYYDPILGLDKVVDIADKTFTIITIAKKIIELIKSFF